MITRRTLFALLGALLLIGSSALIAVAATKKKAAAPTEIKLACIKGNGTLRYITRDSQCSTGNDKILRIDPGPVYVCVKKHGTLRNPRKVSAARRLPAGSTRHTDELSLCGPQTQPNEMPLTLPNPTRQWFCIEKGDKSMRRVARKPTCRKKGNFPEFVGFVRAGQLPAGNAGGNQGGGQNNRAPVANADTASTDEDVSKQIDVLANDTDADNDNLSVLSVDTTGTHGAVTIAANGQSVTYAPDHAFFDHLKPGETATDTFKYKAKDSNNNTPSNEATVTVTVNGKNDAPVVTAGAGAPATFTENQASPVTVDNGITVADVDSANLAGATAAITTGLVSGDTLTFTAASGITGSYNSGTGVLTLTGNATPAQYQTALRSVQFATPSEDPGIARTVTFKVRDAATESAAATRGVTVAPVNDAPVHSTPGAQTTNEDTTKVLSGANAISITDVDAHSDDLETHLTVTHGTLTLATLAGLTSNTGNGTNDVTFRGSLAELNAALDGLSYAPTGNYNGPDSLTVATTDLGHNGSGGPQTDSDSFDITVGAVNDAPVNSVPSGLSTSEDTAKTMSGADKPSVSDVDAGSDPLKITLTATNGVLDLGGTSGLSGVTGNGTSTVSFTGSQSNTNAALDGLKFTPALNFNATASIELKSEDQGSTGGGNKIDTDSFDVTVSAVNDAPVNSVPSAQSTSEDTAKTLSGANAPAVADVDAGSDPLKMTLTATNGTLQLNGTAGLSGVTGNGGSTVGFTGSQSATNAALNGLIFSPTPNFFGTASIEVKTEDQGSTGSGGNQIDTDSFNITVNAVNDAPVLSPTGGASTFAENSPTPATVDGTFGVSDVDSANLTGATVQITPASVRPGDVLAISPNPQNGITGAYNSGTGELTLTGTASVANYQTALRTVTFTTPSDDPRASRTLTYNATDGTTPAAAANVALLITEVNDAPLNAVPATQTTAEDTPKTLTGANAPSVADVDAATDPLKITLTITGGAVQLDGTTGLSEVTGDGTGTVSFKGSQASVNAVLDGMQFSPSSNFNGTATIQVKTEDQGFTGTGGNLVDTDSFDVTVSAVNDAPVNSVPSGLSTDEDVPKTMSGADKPSVSDVDASSSPLKITLTATSGTLDLSGTSGLSGVTGNGTGTVTFTGSQSDTNTALDGLKLTPPLNFHGTATIELKTEDQGFTGSGGNKIDTDTFDIAVNSINDAPVNSVPSGLTTPEDTPKTMSGTDKPSVSDVDAGSDPLKITLTATNGTLDLSGTAGLTGVSGNGTALVSFTGSQSDTNSALDGLKLTPTLNFSGTASIELKTEDQGSTGSGGNKSDTDTFDIAVNAVNDTPVVETSTGPPSAFTEASGTPVTIDGGVSITDVDSGNLNRVTVAITGGYQATDVLHYTTTNGIVATSNTGGVLTLEPTGPATSAPKTDFEAAARTVQFSTPSTSPGPSRTITFRARDDANAESGIVATAQRTVTINQINDQPVVTLSSNTAVPFPEDASPVAVDSALTVADSDATTLTGATIDIGAGYVEGQDTLDFTAVGPITGSFDPPSGTLTLDGNGTVAQYQTALRSVVFDTTDQNPVDNRTITFVVDDGEGAANSLSDPKSRDIDPTPVNDKPVITLPSGPVAFSEATGTPVVLDSAATVGDVDSNTLTSATVSINGGFQTNTDILGWTDNANITETYSATTGILTLTNAGTATFADFQAVFRSVTFDSTSLNPGPSRGIDFRADDGAAFNNLSDIQTKTVNIAQVNDAPALTQPDGVLTYTEDSPSSKHHLQIAPNLGATDPDSANLTSATVTIRAADYQSGQDVLSVPGALPGGITFNFSAANGTATLGGSATVANYQAALRSVRYQNSSDAPSTNLRHIDYQVDDGQPSNHASNVVTRDVDVVAVNDAPVATDDTFSAAQGAIGNTTMVVNDPTDGPPTATGPKKSITGSILTGDADVDGPSALVVDSAGSDAAGTNGQTADGGTVTVEPDGDFTFHPAASASCSDPSDTFNYKISDGNTPTAGTDVGQVTISIAGCVWYVNNNASGNSGTSSAPFDTLAQAETASGNNHTVFVFDGDNSTTGLDTGYAMNSGERLIGESGGLTVDPDQGGPLGAETLQPANPGARPTLTANNEDVISLDDGNEVRGFNIDPQGTGGGIAGASGDVAGTIDDVNIVDTGTAGQQPALELASTSGTFNVSNLAIDNSGATSPPATAVGVRLNSAGTVNFDPASNITIKTKGAPAVDSFGTIANPTSLGTSTFDDITVTGSSAGGVKISNTGGTTNLGNGAGTDLDLTTTSGTDPALLLDTAGTVSVDTAGTDDVHATGGPAISVGGTTIGTAGLKFDDVDSTGSATNGISLSGLGDKQFSAASGDIGGASGVSFSVSGGSGDVTYPGNLNDGGGQAASISGRSGGTVLLSGQLNDGVDQGGGIALSSNTGGATTFTNGTKTINTTTNGGNQDAVVMSGSDGHTLNLTGGGLNIDTGNGKGIEATTSGTLNVTGTGNTIDTGSGKALNVSSTDVGGTPLTFERISSNGANGGILLNATGNNPALTVTGTGGTCTNANTTGCSGGVIQNTTGADSATATPLGTGVVVNDADGVSLTRMHIHDHSNYGIRGTSMNGFTLADSVINGTNGTSSVGGIQDGSIRMDNLLGSASILRSHIQGGFTDNVRVDNNTGTLDRLTIQNSTIGPNSTTNGNIGVVVTSAINTASTLKLTVDNTTFTSSRAHLFQVDVAGNSGGDIVFTNNTLSNNHPSKATGGGGALLYGGTTGTTTLLAQNNTIRDTLSTAMLIRKSPGTGTLSGTVNGNFIGVTGVANSGSQEGNGIEAEQTGGGVMTLAVTNNIIRQINVFGIDLAAGRGGSASGGQMNLAVSGNTITERGNLRVGTPDHGLNIQSGNIVGDSYHQCVDLGPNSITGSGNAAGGGVDLRLRQRFDSYIKLISPAGGYGGANNNNSAVETFAANEVGGSPSAGATNSVSTGGPGFIGGTSCP